jgi:hypothetical protein
MAPLSVVPVSRSRIRHGHLRHPNHRATPPGICKAFLFARRKSLPCSGLYPRCRRSVVPLDQIIAASRLQEIPGIGDAIVDIVTSFTGRAPIQA